MLGEYAVVIAVMGLGLLCVMVRGWQLALVGVGCALCL